ncbi:MAG: NapC/NirT family cytochrome c [Candidatus Marinimicrobia bacterium]|nr:NapC/NirT family cytochrome c [Candidatus Neomarinimicrobiota bacterium]
MKFFQRYLLFLQFLTMNWIGRIGVILTSTSFISFIFLEGLNLVGVFRNTYTGIVTYFILPMLFIVGLILLPIAWRMQKRETGATLDKIIHERLGKMGYDAKNFWEHIIPVLLALTVITVVFIVAAGSSAMHYMDDSEFCGTACHEIMGPEWAAYSASPHSRVPCVDCHIGEGVQALAAAKVNGARQAILSLFNKYDRPIQTPIHNLRPARETCGKCHWPEKHYGSKLVKHNRYLEDEANTLQFNTLNLKVDATNGVGSGIHWHIAEENEVRYTSLDDQRETMIWVDVKRDNGEYHRYRNTKLKDSTFIEPEAREMDCVDCHNRATHIYQQPDDAMDKALSRGLIDVGIPFIKREGLAALIGEYQDKQSGLQAIEQRLVSFYAVAYPDTNFPALASSIEAVQQIYQQNIYPRMNIGWNTYPNHLGHKVEFGCFSCHNFMQHEQSDGCFRCHNNHIQDDEGKTISNDCTLCHSILSMGEDDPLKYILDNEFRTFEEHKNKYFREEYLQHLKAE